MKFATELLNDLIKDNISLDHIARKMTKGIELYLSPQFGVWCIDTIE